MWLLKKKKKKNFVISDNFQLMTFKLYVITGNAEVFIVLCGWLH